MKIRAEPFIRYSAIIIFSLIFITYIYRKSIYEPKILNENHRFTIGQIIKIEFAAEGGRHADFRYYVKEKHYIGSIALDDTKDIQPKVGQRYFVKYYLSDPTINELILSDLVSDSLIDVPSDGWEIMPSIN
jgi:hypothetical protein